MVESRIAFELLTVKCPHAASRLSGTGYPPAVPEFAGTSPAEINDDTWLTPGVRGIGTASLLSDLGHEIPTSLLPSLLTSVGSAVYQAVPR